MDEGILSYFENLSPSEKIIFVLKSHEEFGGPQSAKRLQETLKIKRKNLDSLLSKLSQKGSIVRVQPGIYKYPGDNRSPRK
jgi:predicted transcriptional regulator of viral defense system